GLPWVAKRFFNIGAGEEQVEIQENHEQVVKEITRLSKAAYFLQEFNAEAKRQDVDVDNGIHVTDFKLAIEVFQDGLGPSTASGVAPTTDPGLVVWLFEPRRSSPVKHWSGTNEYPPWPRNKLGSTLTAFAHYAYLISLETIVFCDLQTTPYFSLTLF
ncbi:hypothetical protein C8R47DRAFT_997389, partial [Mycena vitilis]